MNCSEEMVNSELIRVTCEADGIYKTGFVSSFHLIDGKQKQLKEALRRAAFNAFIEDKAAA